GMYSHYEYLGDGETDPRPLLIEYLLKVIPRKGSIFAYYMPFEKARLEELAEAFPDYRQQLLAICDRLVDLIIPFRERHIYHYKMNGSASMKSVLPALFPELDYSKLSINEGSMASLAYLSLKRLNDTEQVSLTRQHLLEYCKADTWGMVELNQYLKNAVTPKTIRLRSRVNS